MSPFSPRTSDPKEAIRDRLRFYASRGHPCIPEMDTIQTLKAHGIPGHQLHSVTFQDTSGTRWYFTYFLNQREDGTWLVKTSGGSREHEQVAPQGTWANLRCSFIANEFQAGGEVFDHGRDITRVRLISSNNRILEDTVQNSLVLFWSHEEIRLPLQAEFYNRSGELVASEEVCKVSPPLDTLLRGNIQDQQELREMSEDLRKFLEEGESNG